MRRRINLKKNSVHIFAFVLAMMIFISNFLNITPNVYAADSTDKCYEFHFLKRHNDLKAEDPYYSITYKMEGNDIKIINVKNYFDNSTTSFEKMDNLYDSVVLNTCKRLYYDLLECTLISKGSGSQIVFLPALVEDDLDVSGEILNYFGYYGDMPKERIEQAVASYDGEKITWGREGKEKNRKEYIEYVQKNSNYNSLSAEFFGLYLNLEGSWASKTFNISKDNVSVKELGGNCEELGVLLTDENILRMCLNVYNVWEKAKLNGDKEISERYEHLVKYMLKTDPDEQIYSYLKYDFYGADVSTNDSLYLNVIENNNTVASFLIGEKDGNTFKHQLFINEASTGLERLLGNVNTPELGTILSNENYNFLIYKNNGTTVEEQKRIGNDYLLLLNQSTGNLELYKKDGYKYKNLVTVFKDAIADRVFSDKDNYIINYEVETKDYVVTKTGNVGSERYYIVKKSDGSYAYIHGNVNKLHALNDEDGINEIYFLYSKVSDTQTGSSNDMKIAYYYTGSTFGTGSDYDDDESVLFENFYKDILGSERVYMSVAEYKKLEWKGMGQSASNPFPKGKFMTEKDDPSLEDADSKTLNSAANDFMTYIPVNEIFSLPDTSIRNNIVLYAKTNMDAQLGYAGEKEAVQDEYKSWVFRIGKSIIMFLVFITLLFAAIKMIINNQNAEERASALMTYQHLIVGVIIFITAGFFLLLITEFTTQSFERIEAISSEFDGPSYNVGFETLDFGVLGWITSQFIDLATWISEWMIEQVVKTSGAGDYNILKAVYDVYDDDGNVDLLSPFTEKEWETYMLGYKALIGVGICILSIAFIRIAYMLLINAGNAEKVKTEKETAGRIVIAILMIIIAPYFIRILLAIFNYLVAMLPVDYTSSKFDLMFEDYGLIGSLANASFIWVKLSIFLTFFVRKIMIVLMTMATPIVFGIWAFSNQTRSFSLWVGELVSNAATQFCYGLTFMIVMLFAYEGQNAFVMLAISMLIPRFASFFKDSLQGYVQRWGGINEESEASAAGGTVKETFNKAKRKVNGIGGIFKTASNLIDRDGTKKSGKVLHNVGSLLQGRPQDLKTKGDILKSIRKKSINDHAEASRNLKNASEEARETIEKNNELFKQRAKEIMDGKEDVEKYRGNEDYEKICKYVDAKKDEEEKRRIKELAIKDVKDYSAKGNLFDLSLKGKKLEDKYVDKLVKQYDSKDTDKTDKEACKDEVEKVEDGKKEVFDSPDTFSNSSTKTESGAGSEDTTDDKEESSPKETQEGKTPNEKKKSSSPSKKTREARTLENDNNTQRDEMDNIKKELEQAIKSGSRRETSKLSEELLRNIIEQLKSGYIDTQKSEECLKVIIKK